MNQSPACAQHICLCISLRVYYNERGKRVSYVALTVCGESHA